MNNLIDQQQVGQIRLQYHGRQLAQLRNSEDCIRAQAYTQLNQYRVQPIDNQANIQSVLINRCIDDRQQMKYFAFFLRIAQTISPTILKTYDQFFKKLLYKQQSSSLNAGDYKININYRHKSRQTEQKILQKYLRYEDQKFLTKITQNDEENQDHRSQQVSLQQVQKIIGVNIKNSRLNQVQQRKQLINSQARQSRPNSSSKVKVIKIFKQHLTNQSKKINNDGLTYAINKSLPISTGLLQKQYIIFCTDSRVTSSTQAKQKDDSLKKQEMIPRKIQKLQPQPSLNVDAFDFVNIVQMGNYPQRQRSPTSKHHQLISFDLQNYRNNTGSLSYQASKNKQKSLTLNNYNTSLFTPTDTPISTPKNKSRLSSLSNQHQIQSICKSKSYTASMKSSSDSKSGYQFAHVQNKFNHRYRQNSSDSQQLQSFQHNKLRKHKNSSFSSSQNHQLIKKTPEKYKTIDYPSNQEKPRVTKDLKIFTEASHYVKTEKQSIQMPQNNKLVVEDSTLSASLQMNKIFSHSSRDNGSYQPVFGNQPINFKNSLIIQRQRQIKKGSHHAYKQVDINNPDNKIYQPVQKNIQPNTAANNLLTQRKSLPVRSIQLNANINLNSLIKQKQFETRFKKYQMQIEEHPIKIQQQKFRQSWDQMSYKNSDNSKPSPLVINEQQQLRKKIIKLNKDKTKDKSKSNNNLSLTFSRHSQITQNNFLNPYAQVSNGTSIRQNRQPFFYNSTTASLSNKTQPLSITIIDKKQYAGGYSGDGYNGNINCIKTGTTNSNNSSQISAIRSKYQKSQHKLQIQPHTTNTNPNSNYTMTPQYHKPPPTQRYYLPKCYNHSYNATQSHAAQSQAISSYSSSNTTSNIHTISNAHANIDNNALGKGKNLTISYNGVKPAVVSNRYLNIDEHKGNKKISISYNSMNNSMNSSQVSHNTSCIVNQVKQYLPQRQNTKNSAACRPQPKIGLIKHNNLSITTTNINPNSQPNQNANKNEYKNINSTPNSHNPHTNVVADKDNIYSIVCGADYRTVCQENRNYEVELEIIKNKYRDKDWDRERLADKQKAKDKDRNQKIVNVNKLNNTTFHFQTPSKKRQMEIHNISFSQTDSHFHNSATEPPKIQIQTLTSTNQNPNNYSSNIKRSSNLVGKIKYLSQSFQVKPEMGSEKKANVGNFDNLSSISMNIKNRYGSSGYPQNQNAEKHKTHTTNSTSTPSTLIPTCNPKTDNLNIAANKTNTWITINNIMSTKNKEVSLDGFSQSVCLQKMEKVERDLRELGYKGKNSYDRDRDKEIRDQDPPKQKNKHKDKTYLNLLQSYQENSFKRSMNKPTQNSSKNVANNKVL